MTLPTFMYAHPVFIGGDGMTAGSGLSGHQEVGLSVAQQLQKIKLSQACYLTKQKGCMSYTKALQSTTTTRE